MGRRLVNGSETAGIAADDRGLHYGDGLFETMSASSGRIRNFGLHMSRLEDGCLRLGLPEPDPRLIERECAEALGELNSGVVKLVLTRGPGPRGYRPPPEPSITRVVTASAGRAGTASPEALTIRVCETRLGLNARLAGIKHLNRLEQVLACSEWSDPDVAEGLMLAADGRLICATAANVFLVSGGRLRTPDIRDCGVMGVMRHVVLRAARELALDVEIADLGIEALATADEVFLTNAVAGIRPVRALIGHGEWRLGGVTQLLLAHLAGRGEA
jgi:4-amino-4-deoxychorismate lyase